MGLFGIKTRKEKEAEARAQREREDEALIKEIKHWSREHCKRELDAIKAGRRDYSYSVRSAIDSRHSQCCYEDGLAARRREADRKIEAQRKEVDRLKGRSIWDGPYGGEGAYIATTSTTKIDRMKREVSSAERELARLQRERDNIGKGW